VIQINATVTPKWKSRRY